MRAITPHPSPLAMTAWLVFCTFILTGAGILASCSDSKDGNDTPLEPTISHKLQVTMVFEPKELGDNGYADRVMAGLERLRKADLEDGVEDVNFQFISTYDDATTFKLLLNRMRENYCPFSGRVFDRRLLILSEEYMTIWLDSISNHLQSTDEVLVLKTVSDNIDQVSKETGLGPRLHGLNISAASSVKKFLNLIIAKGYHTTSQWLLSCLFRKQHLREYHDSIPETIDDVLPESSYKTFYVFTNDSTNSLININSKRSINEDIFLNIGFIHQIYEQADFYGFTISDLGIYNSAYDYYLMGSVYEESKSHIQVLMLDTEQNFIPRFCINRLFDKAIEEWVNKWWSLTPGSMPSITMHGGWDNYLKDNIPYNE